MPNTRENSKTTKNSSSLAPFDTYSPINGEFSAHLLLMRKRDPVISTLEYVEWPSYFLIFTFGIHVTLFILTLIHSQVKS